MAIQHSCICMDVLPCLRFQKYTIKPIALSYPNEPQTIGEHIKKKRWDLKLEQTTVAKNLNVSAESVCNWENNNTSPQIKHYPAIIKFLGYSPINFDESTLSGRLLSYRWKHGLSNKKLGKLVGIDGSTLLDWENQKTVPQKAQLLKIKNFLQKFHIKEGT